LQSPSPTPEGWLKKAKDLTPLGTLLASCVAATYWIASVVERGNAESSKNYEMSKAEVSKISALRVVEREALLVEREALLEKLRDMEKVSTAQKAELEAKLKAQEEINKEHLQRRGIFGYIFGW